jgi:serine/threonine protein kinase
VLYFMATGRPPFRAASAMAVLHRICHDTHRPVWQRNRDIPDALCDVIDRLLEKKPGKRFSSAEEVQQHLAMLLNRLQQHGLGRRRFRGWHGKRLRRFAIVGAAALATVAAIIGVAVGTLRKPVSPQSVPDTQQSAVREAAPTEQQKSQYEANERQFLDDLDSAGAALERSSGGWFYLHDGDDPWQRDLDSLKLDMTQYELESN